MADLHSAAERLQTAMDRIEKAVEHDGGADGAGDLKAALKTAQRENAALQDVARKIADRLDGTIERLQNSA